MVVSESMFDVAVKLWCIAVSDFQLIVFCMSDVVREQK